jgi:WD40 repeat protein/mono/diheme cytochrome c family protein
MSSSFNTDRRRSDDRSRPPSPPAEGLPRARGAAGARPLAVALCVVVVAATAGPAAAAEPISFRRQVAPILVEQCLACHGPKKAEGGYRVDTYAEALAAGDSATPGFLPQDPQGSEAFRRIVATDLEERMPLDGDPLPAEQVAVLRRWIEEGATFDGPDKKAALPTILPPPIHPPAPDAYPQPVPIAALAFSPDGSQLVVGGYHELTVWDPADGHLLRRIGNIGQRTSALCFSPDGKAVAVACGTPGRLGEVRIVDVASGRVTAVLGTAADMVLDVAYSPAGDRLAVGGSDGVLRVYAADGGAQELAIPCHSDWVHAVAWSADGGRLATASRDKTAKVIDVKTGELLGTFSGHGQPVKGVAFHPDGAEMFSAGADKKIQRWKLADTTKIAEIGFADEVSRLPTGGGFLFAASADKTVRQFDGRTQAEVRRYAGATDWPLCVAFHAGTARIAAGCFNGEIRVWNAADGAAVTTILAAPHLAKR